MMVGPEDPEKKHMEQHHLPMMALYLETVALPVLQDRTIQALQGLAK